MSRKNYNFLLLRLGNILVILMRFPLVSVIIPCFNIEKYAQLAIQSIIDQSYKQLEIILIEDGSKDETKAILENFVKIDQRIKIIYNSHNRGLAYSLNRGISAATGEFIARMDGDDISHPNRIERQLIFLSENPSVSIVGCKSYPINQYGSLLTSADITYCSADTLRFSTYLANPFIHGSVLCHASILKKYKYKDIGSEDFELWCQMNSNGIVFSNLNQVFYLFRKNQNSYSNLNENKQVHSHNKVSKEYLSKLLNKELNQKSVAIINHRPTSKINLNEFREGFKLFRQLIEQQNNQSTEFKLFVKNQTLNIFIQAIKHSASNKVKQDLIFQLIKWLFDFQAFKFIFLKLKLYLISWTKKKVISKRFSIN